MTYYPCSPIEIRDGTIALLKTISGFESVNTAITMPVKTYNGPQIAVYNSGERTEPDGDSNVGEPHFIHRLTLVIDMIVFASADTIDADVVGYVETAKQVLLSNTSWLELFESLERIDTNYVYQREGGENTEQGMIEIEVMFRSKWPPAEVNDFDFATTTIKTSNNIFDNTKTFEIEIRKK